MPALFSSYTYRYFTQQHLVCVCPSLWSRQPDLLFTTREQQWFTEQAIYNLQPARNVFYEMCFVKKEARGPTQPGSFAYFFVPTCWKLMIWTWCENAYCLMWLISLLNNWSYMPKKKGLENVWKYRPACVVAYWHTDSCLLKCIEHAGDFKGPACVWFDNRRKHMFKGSTPVRRVI